MEGCIHYGIPRLCGAVDTVCWNVRVVMQLKWKGFADVKIPRRYVWPEVKQTVRHTVNKDSYCSIEKQQNNWTAYGRKQKKIVV